RKGTIEGIKKDIDFVGPAVWILVCSIFIASIGLNTNSAAVIIGAMLISPLMGPILGIGLGLGTNDWPTVSRALRNFGIAVAISLITSLVYFSITPLTDATPEMIARTRPTFLDAMIAIFGGLAGIVAGSRKEKSNVVPGVAIATALMPPLCTAGYGLASGNYEYFFGAFYLFFLNSVLICLATVVVVRYLNFPVVHQVDEGRETRFRWFLTIFALGIIIPSGYLFYNIIKEETFRRKAEEFISENIKYEGCYKVKDEIIYSDSINLIEVIMMGQNIIPDRQIATWQAQLLGSGLANTKLEVFQPKDNSIEWENKQLELRNELQDMDEKIRVGMSIYLEKDEQIRSNEKKIDSLEQQLKQIEHEGVQFELIRKEVKIQYEQVEKFAYANSIETDYEHKTDTIHTFLVHWASKTSRSSRRKNEQKLAEWLKVRTEFDSLRVINY
ncbi:MAG: DUF389 domain-containing protein, partial [Bacteroidota bacterium]